MANGKLLCDRERVGQDAKHKRAEALTETAELVEECMVVVAFHVPVTPARLPVEVVGAQDRGELPQRAMRAMR